MTFYVTLHCTIYLAKSILSTYLPCADLIIIFSSACAIHKMWCVCYSNSADGSVWQGPGHIQQLGRHRVRRSRASASNRCLALANTQLKLHLFAATIRIHFWCAIMSVCTSLTSRRVQRAIHNGELFPPVIIALHLRHQWSQYQSYWCVQPTRSPLFSTDDRNTC